MNIDIWGEVTPFPCQQLPLPRWIYIPPIYWKANGKGLTNECDISQKKTATSSAMMRRVIRHWHCVTINLPLTKKEWCLLVTSDPKTDNWSRNIAKSENTQKLTPVDICTYMYIYMYFLIFVFDARVCNCALTCLCLFWLLGIDHLAELEIWPNTAS